jgi:hypothetical protein
MRFFFNIAGAVYDPDDLGEEFDDISDARHHAVVVAAELIKDDPHAVWTGKELRIEVTDAGRMVMFTVIVVGVDAPLYAPPLPERARATPTVS